MSASASNETIYYNSLYRHGVDDKRRLQIPAKWRPADEGVQFTLVLWPPKGDTNLRLLVLPPTEWEALAQKLKNMSYGDPHAEALRRIVGTRSDRVALDKAGRICIPEILSKPAGIDDEAVLLGLVDRFEIWNPARYEAASAADEQLSMEALRHI